MMDAIDAIIAMDAMVAIDAMDAIVFCNQLIPYF